MLFLSRGSQQPEEWNRSLTFFVKESNRCVRLEVGVAILKNELRSWIKYSLVNSQTVSLFT